MVVGYISCLEVDYRALRNSRQIRPYSSRHSPVTLAKAGGKRESSFSKNLRAAEQAVFEVLSPFVGVFVNRLDSRLPPAFARVTGE